MAARIEDYALIGDCRSAGLVSRDGSIDWLCWPRFDSDACFARLLGDETHGMWWIRPQGRFRTHRRYRHRAVVLDTVFETDEASATLTDFMPPHDAGSHVVRIVEGRRGRIRLRMDLRLRYGYGRIVPWMSRFDATTQTA